MDETTVFATIGKMYVEVSRLQQIAESQQRRILELETQLSESKNKLPEKNK